MACSAASAVAVWRFHTVSTEPEIAWEHDRQLTIVHARPLWIEYPSLITYRGVDVFGDAGSE